MSVSKVSLDGVGVAGGSLTFKTGVGAVFAGINAMAIKNGLEDLYKNCR